MMFLRQSNPLRGILTASAAAFIAAALHPAAWPQQIGEKPISWVAVGGLDSAEGAKILLIRAAGNGCADSVLLPVDAGRTDVPDKQYFTSGSGNRKGSTETPVYRTAIHVDGNCWCSDANADKAGFAVMAPGRAVYYRVNRPFLREPSIEEKKAGKTRVPIFDLCLGNETSADGTPLDEIRVDLRPKREVPVVVWAGDGEARGMAKDELANLDWIFDKELAGITVRPSYRVLKAPHSLKELLPGCYPADSESACCAAVQASQIFDPGALNLYYGAGQSSWTCPDNVAASFVRDAPILGDAAHELSHALGLKRSDHETKYDAGHTDGAAAFDWSNVMWSGTHFLKNSLSPGQAFWLTQSCTSWLGLNNSCLTCVSKDTDAPGTPSRCPPFSVGAEAAVHTGAPCSGSPACDVQKTSDSAVLYVPARQKKRIENCDVPTSIYKNGKALETQLKDRYSALRQHVRGRGDLALGSATSWDFLRRWEPSFAYNIAPVDDTRFNSTQEADILPHALLIRSVSELRKKPLPACGPTQPGGQ